MAACANCGEENPDRAKFCLDCGSPLTAAAPAPVAVTEEERKLDTLLFVDLVGSTALAESLDPEDVLSLLQLYYTRLRAELERFGGTVEKYIGDAIVTHFGVPVAHEDDPERAVRAALAILKTVDVLNSEDPIRQIQVRIGVATGEVIVTLGARAEEGKGIAWGDILNTAARIESAAPVMGILVGEETYKASAHAIDYEEREPIEAKGKSEPVRVWQALGVREATRLDRVLDTPLVGRSAEVASVLGLWERAQAEQRPAIATLIGDPGIGKTRLLYELADRAAAADASVRWGRCLSYGEGITYWPVVELLEDAAGILKSDDTGTVSTKLGTLLESLGCDDLDQLRTMAVALANLIGVPTTPRGTYSAEEISQAELHWGIRRVFELQAAQQPLVLVFEDLHWAEPTLLDLLDFIAESERAPVLVLATARRELEQLRPLLCTDGERRLALPLSALDDGDSEALLVTLLAGRKLPPGSSAEELIRNASGNPLFLEETVGMLADGGFLDGDGSQGPVEELRVPTSLQAMIGSRLDGLPTRDKRSAQHAAVMGMRFWTGAVAELSGSDADTGTSLEALEERDFVRSQDESTVAAEREWAFKHALLRDVAYGRLPKGRRATLHVRFVDWVTAKSIGAEDELVEIVAAHLEQACKLGREVGRSEVPPPVERAVDALMRAAEKAERHEGIREADRYYTRALDLIGDEVSGQALELRLARAGTLSTLGEFKKADEFLTQVADGASEAGRADLRARALIARANIELKQARPDDARGRLQEAESIAAALGDPTLQIRVLFESSNLHSWFDGDLETAVAEVRQSLAIAEEHDDKGLLIEGHMRLGTLLFNVGDLTQAEDQLVRCSALLVERGSLRDEARATFLLALVKYYRGELDEAERLGLQALSWFERTSDRFFQLQNLRTLGLHALARADLPLAEQRFQDAIPLAVEIGGWLVVEIYRCLVNVLIRQDRLSDARELAAFAWRNLPEEDVYARAAVLLIDAGLRTAEGRRPEAEECFTEALRLLEQQRLPLDLGEARLAFGRALRQLGDEPGARAELGRAREDLERMGALGLVDEIDRELAALTEGAGRAGPLASA